jgi:hypothetical protein
MAKQPAPGKSGNQYDSQKHETSMKTVERVAGKATMSEPYADHTRHHELRRETKSEGMHSSHAEHRSETHHSPKGE